MINQLEEISASSNYLNNFDYNCLNPATLKDLRIWNNNLISTDVNVFSHLTNLTYLGISNSEDWIQKNKGNQFTGSLSSLQSLTKLQNLNIRNTDVGHQGIAFMLKKLGSNLEFSYLKENKQSITFIKPSEKIKVFITNQGQTINKKFEWINFTDFVHVDPIAEGGYGKVFSLFIKIGELLLSPWKKPPIIKNNMKKKFWKKLLIITCLMIIKLLSVLDFQLILTFKNT